MGSVANDITTTATQPQINWKDFELIPVHAKGVWKYDNILYNDRICIVVSSEKYENQYSGSVPKRHIILSTLREGQILEMVIPPNQRMMRITANGMAMMPEQFPKQPVLAGKAKRNMIIMIRDRICRIQDVTFEKVRETTLVRIQARTMDEGRCESMEIAAEVPLELPGRKRAFKLVRETVWNSRRGCVTSSPDGVMSWGASASTADTLVEAPKAQEEVVHQDVAVQRRGYPDGCGDAPLKEIEGCRSEHPESISSITRSTSSATTAPCESKELDRIGVGLESCESCRNCNWYVQQWVSRSQLREISSDW
ncbi:hypothetical protein FKW77_000436 [Venturia effusa]|uniref:Uncharacterized protein n=1 Tax=Venturia effusa TaxID=50376 RepID=A0A517LA88_9PEZI|nr:hypothetical protein FKW77_000436 [Venturia effusa]